MFYCCRFLRLFYGLIFFIFLCNLSFCNPLFPLINQEKEISNNILIFSPHPDDETLGCGGLIINKIKNAREVLVIFITNGDAYTFSAEREFKSLFLKNYQFIEYGALRQKEAQGALKILKLKRSPIFLSFPDRGLKKIWEDFWEKPYNSQYTKTNFSPYPQSFQKEVNYTGVNLFNNIEKILKTYQPDEIYLPDPYDQHPDHRAAFCFVNLVLEKLKLNNLLKNTKIFVYPIHHSNWPKTEKGELKTELILPDEFYYLNLKWLAYPLNSREIDLKYQALLNYKSQLITMKKFLFSFMKTNELFGIVPEYKVEEVNEKTIFIDGKKEDWINIPPYLFNLDKIYSFSNIYVIRDSKALYFRFDPNKRIFNFQMNLRGINKKGESKFIRINFKSKNIVFKDIIEIKIPLENLNHPQMIIFNFTLRKFLFKEEESGYNILEF
ncbi:MAG: PIG-L family deacetylase [Armatimonadetes bacterium]|nr:PIG-L family deacetylase [Armatimonadota bacterium]